MWNCPYMKIKNTKKEFNIKNLILCSLCGGKSHIAKDCPKYKYIKENDDIDIHYDYYNMLKN